MKCCLVESVYIHTAEWISNQWRTYQHFRLMCIIISIYVILWALCFGQITRNRLQYCNPVKMSIKDSIHPTKTKMTLENPHVQLEIYRHSWLFFPLSCQVSGGSNTNKKPVRKVQHGPTITNSSFRAASRYVTNKILGAASAEGVEAVGWMVDGLWVEWMHSPRETIRQNRSDIGIVLKGKSKQVQLWFRHLQFNAQEIFWQQTSENNTTSSDNNITIIFNHTSPLRGLDMHT